MSSDNVITIDMDQKCAECRKPGRLGNGLCMGCSHRALMGKAMKTPTGRAVQQHIRATLDAARASRKS